jgi:hypothetical protein
MKLKLVAALSALAIPSGKAIKQEVGLRDVLLLIGVAETIEGVRTIAQGISQCLRHFAADHHSELGKLVASGFIGIPSSFEFPLGLPANTLEELLQVMCSGRLIALH